MKILICQLRNHGDIIRSFPLIESLKATYPSCEVDFTCLEIMADTCRICDAIDDILLQPRLETSSNTFNNSRVCDISKLEKVVLEIRRKEYDVYIDLHGVFQSALIGLLANIPVRIGRSHHTAKDGAHLMYTHICNIDSWDVNKMERHIKIAKTYFKDLEFKYSENMRWQENNIVAILPGSSELGILKRWDSKRYVELAKLLSLNYKVIFILGPEEVELYEYLNSKTTGSISVKSVNSFQGYKELFSRCRFVIGNDSAALHLSIWQEVPTYMICGPTKGVINGIWKYGLGTTIEKEYKCLECNIWSGKCENKHECMKTLDVHTVYKEVLDSLEANNG